MQIQNSEGALNFSHIRDQPANKRSISRGRQQRTKTPSIVLQTSNLPNQAHTHPATTFNSMKHQPPDFTLTRESPKVQLIAQLSAI
jgi:hypothetical protein